MPELPEVETVRRGANQVTLNREITGGDVLLDRTIAYPFSVADFLNGISGKAIAQWHRRGKYLLAELVKGSRGVGEQGSNSRINSEFHSRSVASASIPNSEFLGVHLRMTGQLLWLPRDEPLHKHTRVRLFFAENWELRFVDQRTFGQMWWVPPERAVESVVTGLATLGPDPFSPDFSVEYFAAKLRDRRRPIKNALLDQSIVAGIGNIYADEALFRAGVQPQTLCADLRSPQISCLRTAILEVLEASINAGGTTFSNFLNVQGVNGNYGGVAWVYNRAGKPCHICNTPILKLRLAGRSAHFCPQCQK
ncbi:MAG: Formamidopyrimidine-DNA glycosylase [Chroococcidiopsis sp. SAG 2025]|uniref:DNA-formamidopyrimidine glycosylase n=1 Tax=Chroococcidiopsis sp. SAG 2025 TaxID=171389 RepID=UPI00293700E7|nr:DNA-formamidopyrimidine glycosylase [Chroococcidiopsis sp. SAG 2025]MDV2993517.1 Formamidopyrimidine-DNA glycosylase [Chroococcidiopsis sp. SAG 2025]